MNEILVDIIMPTFNHERYIGQAIESVLMQECDFQYRLIIGDDCSVDNTYDICAKYFKLHPDKMQIYKNDSNLGLIRNYKKLFDSCTAKYIAILESDDYWIDPCKLQKQVDVMEENEEIGLVHTKSSTIYEDGEVKINYHLKYPVVQYADLYSMIIRGEYGIVPLTVLFRRKLIDLIDFDFCQKNNLKTIDAFLWPEFARKCKFFFVDSVTGFYRFISTSESNTNNFDKIEEFNSSSLIITKYYLSKYLVNNLDETEVMSRRYYFLTYKALQFRLFKKAKLYKKKLYLKSLKNIWLWLMASSILFYPLFLAYVNFQKNGSKFKQKYFITKKLI